MTSEVMWVRRGWWRRAWRGALSALALSTAALAAGTLGGCAGAPQKTTAPKLKPVTPTALREFDRGLRALRIGGPEADEQAAARFEKAVQLDPSLWEAWHNLGVLRARAGDDTGAISAFTRALAVNAASAETRRARAEAARRLRRFGAARDDFAQLVADDADDLQARLRLAELLREAGDHDRAQAEVREVLRRDPGNADANLELGLVYLAADRTELAELVLQRAATASPKSPLVMNALGLVSLARGREQEAFARFDKATELDPRFTAARFNKASVLLDAGDFAAARAELLAGGGPDDDDVAALLALGVAQRGAGNHKEARAAWERVLRVAPRNADALWNLAVLEMDFVRDEAAARRWLGRYLDTADGDHPKHADAEARRKELGPDPAAAPTAPTDDKPGRKSK